MTASIEPFAWPAARLGEALEALVHRSGLVSPRAASVRLAGPRDEVETARWLESAADALGIEAEPFVCGYADVRQVVAAAGPAILRLPGDAGGRFLILASADYGRPTLLTPDGDVVRVEAEALRAALCCVAESEVLPTVDQVLAGAGLRAARRVPGRDALLGELLRPRRIKAGWFIRASPGAPLRILARELGLAADLWRFVAGHLAFYGLWIASWSLLGAALLQGRADLGWFVAWALMLATLIPLKVATTACGGKFAVRTGLLLRRRLLHGALALDPDQVRTMGSGQLLGRVLETQVLDTIALTGGLLTATSLLEVAFAGWILANGAGGAMHALLLVGFLALGCLFARRECQKRRLWTDARFDMTHDIVERMVGHRTRLAQEDPAERHAGEDEALHRYHHLSVDLDQASTWMKGFLPRAWLAAAVLVLGGPFAFGTPTMTALAVSIGGILLAYHAFHDLGEGAERVTTALVAWQRVRLFWDAAATGPAPRAAAGAQLPDMQAADPLLEARHLSFRFPRRSTAVLDSASLAIGRGDRILLEGGSGQGKSTVAALLAGFRTPDSGLILLGGLDRWTLGPREWRRHLVLTPQFHQNHVLLGTLAFNLLMGRMWPPSQADLDEAESTCRSLGLGVLLDRMPGGLQQLVGETGWQLSQGEKSRVYIARALLQKGDVLILDESLAALDPMTLQTTLGFVLEKAETVVVIAHP